MPLDPRILEAIDRMDQSSTPVQRIRVVTVTPEPEAVRFSFRTTVATSPVVEVFHLRTRRGELHFEGAELLRVAFDLFGVARGTQHAIRMHELPQRTQLMFRITAGGPGSAAVVTGRATTGSRRVAFTLRDIRLWNDGDPGFIAGAGELEFGFGLYDAAGYLDRPRRYRIDAESGELLKFPFGTSPCLVLARNGTDRVTVYALAAESDHVFEPFGPWADLPRTVPTATSVRRRGAFTMVDAMQQLTLPSTTGTYRIGVHFTTGPRPVHYDVTGWLTVEVSCPPPSRIHDLTNVEPSWLVVTMGRGGVGAIGSGADGGGPNGRSADGADERSSVVALGGDGTLAIADRPERLRDIDWHHVDHQPVEAVVAAPADDGEIRVATVTDGLLECATLGTDAALHGGWETLATGVTGRPTAARGPEATAIAARTGTSLTVALLPSAAGDEDVVVALEGGVSDPSMAWSTDGSLVVAGLRDDGVVVATELHRGDAGSTGLEPVPSPTLEAVVAAAADDAPVILVGLTRDRLLVTCEHGSDGWSPEWSTVGLLDDLAAAMTDAADLDHIIDVATGVEEDASGSAHTGAPLVSSSGPPTGSFEP